MTEKVPFPVVDPNKNQVIGVFGRKGSGKSVFAHKLFRDWPGVDKLVIDPTGDADPGVMKDLYGRDVVPVVTSDVPDKLPDPPRGGQVCVRYVARPESPTYQDDIDRALAAALFPKTRRVLVWVDEAGEVFPVSYGPRARQMLQQGRHYYASLIVCGPRPMTINPLVLNQCDYVVMFDLPGPADRKRIAECIGVPPTTLDAWLNEARRRGPHWYVIYSASQHLLYLCPPLPIGSDYRHAQQ